MSAIINRLYNLLRKDLKLDDSRPKIFVSVLHDSIKNQSDATATEYKSIFKEDMLKLELKIAESKSDMIKWFFAFFVTLMLMILGLYATILLK
jgi:hypothetical protein